MLPDIHCPQVRSFKGYCRLDECSSKTLKTLIHLGQSDWYLAYNLKCSTGLMYHLQNAVTRLSQQRTPNLQPPPLRLRHHLQIIIQVVHDPNLKPIVPKSNSKYSLPNYIVSLSNLKYCKVQMILFPIPQGNSIMVNHCYSCQWLSDPENGMYFRWLILKENYGIWVSFRPIDLTQNTNLVGLGNVGRRPCLLWRNSLSFSLFLCEWAKEVKD